ncbi:GNAT family N-acetyltransferase [Thiocapsa marina]|uniref:BioF2-like acetyltransferase domain-containing protein n=1 Tax=Thiocapsa marina 5811 TaxID=768671 RepID=F9UAT2_9GAMM|nr:GNAT family N-acetyltransferase [Thiocapsa marina]EGV18550.1 hypothetical protein ThimaDRAFT_1968 [Thiocapsa marina 5811]
MKVQNRYQLRIFRGREDLGMLFEAWKFIGGKMQSPCFVQLPEWTEAFISVEPEARSRFRGILVSKEEKPFAVIPLEHYSLSRFGLRFGAWRLFWPNDMGINDLVCEPGSDLDGLLDAIIETLAGEAEPFDLILFQNAVEGSSVSAMLETSKPRRKVSVYSHDSKYVLCRSSYQSTLAGVSGKFKRNIRRKLRNLNSLGTISFESVRKDTDLEKAFGEFLRTEASSWKGNARTALLYDHALRRFYEELTERLATNRKCVIDTLRLNGEPIAAQYGVITGNTYHLLKIGYNDEYKGQSPGALLLDHTIQICSGHPVIRKISFVTGAKWNDDWAPQKLSVFNHYIYRETLKGGLGLLLHSLKRLAIR